MDNEKLKQFMVPIALLVLVLVGIIYMAPKIYENYQGYVSAQSEVEAKKATIQEKQARIEQYRQKEQAEKEKEKESEKAKKPFYKPVMTGLDTEAVIAGEFAEILQLVRANQIKVRSIKYEYDPSDDAFVSGAGSQYNVARLNMEMIGNYSNYDNFLKEMYKHDHFLDIQSAEIVPYKKNKRVLLINFKVKLYAKK
jgi:Tfp pilus assembly protein PilE